MAANPTTTPISDNNPPIGTAEQAVPQQYGHRQRGGETGGEALQGLRRAQPGSDAAASPARPDEISRNVAGPDDGQDHEQLVGSVPVPGQQRHGQPQIQERHEAGRSRSQSVPVVDDPVQMRGEQAEAGRQQVGHDRASSLIPHPGKQQARGDRRNGPPRSPGRQELKQFQDRDQEHQVQERQKHRGGSQNDDRDDERRQHDDAQGAANHLAPCRERDRIPPYRRSRFW